MSNKTQLQTNNIALDALITRVNAAKDTAASLPEAGGSGGIETVVGTVSTIMAGEPLISTIYYIDGTSSLQQPTTTGSISVLKNSIILVDSHGDVCKYSGDITLIGSEPMSLYIFYVTGDFTLKC